MNRFDKHLHSTLFILVRIYYFAPGAHTESTFHSVYISTIVLTSFSAASTLSTFHSVYISTVQGVIVWMDSLRSTFHSVYISTCSCLFLVNMQKYIYIPLCLYQYRLCVLQWPGASDLHSTLFILVLFSDESKVDAYLHLHSTLFILVRKCKKKTKLGKKIYIPLCLYQYGLKGE